MTSFSTTAVTSSTAAVSTTIARVSIQAYKKQHQQHQHKLHRGATQVNINTLIDVLIALKLPRADIAKRLVTLHMKTDVDEAEKLLDSFYKILEIQGP